MIRYIRFPYRIRRYHFIEEMKELFWGGKLIPQRLQELHYKLDKSYDELFEVGKDSVTNLHSKFYDKYRTGWPEMESIYQKFISEVVARQFDEDFLYQSFPTVRFCIPMNVAVGHYHNDMEFGHPEGEINFIIPLTDSNDTASIYVESEPGKKDFLPMKLRIGELIMFDGNHLTHGNERNLTGSTRVSLDFRVLPISKYDESAAKESVTMKTKYVEGQYYKRFKKT
jgi:ectoine hydroxylase-related dioxygenase (phytanoyl-CoA dioxygenase family)